jgi:hypothetical protein
MRYFATHRALLTNYLRLIDFKAAETDIYASPMSALCSAYPELMEIMTYSVGTAN